MSSFIIFGGSIYYPEGGWRDKKNESNDFEEAVRIGQGIAINHEKVVLPGSGGWYQIVSSDGRILKYQNGEFSGN